MKKDKADTGKRRYSLINAEAHGMTVDAMTYGANKYTPNGWKSVRNGSERYYDAQMRHIEDDRTGELYDDESGLLSLAHAAACAHIRLALKIRQLKRLKKKLKK